MNKTYYSLEFLDKVPKKTIVIQIRTHMYIRIPCIQSHNRE